MTAARWNVPGDNPEDLGESPQATNPTLRFLNRFGEPLLQDRIRDELFDGLVQILHSVSDTFSLL
jgi:hypothetical protein